MKATDAVLESVGSHAVTLEYDRGGEVSREECYPRLTASWRGQAVEVSMNASRYRFSDGTWSDWRVFVERAVPGVTETARRALREACEPLVREWLNSDAYRESRAQAFAWMIRRQIREERINADGPEETLNRYRSELKPLTAGPLKLAIDHLRSLLLLLDKTEVVR